MHKQPVAEGLRAIRRWMADWDAMDENRTLLSPKILSKHSNNKIDQYRYAAVQELRNAIDTDGCNNIAITGVYGSGKSSVIQTYLKELHPCFRNKRVLSISLSNFIDGELKDDNKAVVYENEIEQKIFQHILYKTNQNKTRQTRYGRITHISVAAGIRRAFAILLCILSILLLSVPVSALPINVESWFNNLNPCIQSLFEWGAIGYLCLFFVCITTYLIRRVHLFRIHGKINSSNMELEWEKESSKFDKLLGEILYFFIAGGYRIVIFEDLDRIKTPERLFLKLREINTLLNESDYYKHKNKKVKFVYAIRDEIFSSDIRTKCFDYIISVVPVVDKYNSGDYLIEKYQGKDGIMSNITERDLSVIGMYIGSKRELANIVNEYALCHKAFINGTSETKLLALLVYKNSFPLDYAAAYHKEGCLYSVFANENKKLFYTPLIDELEKQEVSYESAIEGIREKIEASRWQVLGQLAKDNIDQLIIGGREYALSEFRTNDQLYEAFANNSINQYFWSDGKDCSTGDYDFKFGDLVKKAYPEDSSEYYSEMAGNVELLRANIAKQNEVHKQIEIIKNRKVKGLMGGLHPETVNQILELICKPIYEKWKTQKVLSNYTELLKEHLTLLQVFIKEEYIAEDYATYMSHTYPGSLTESDMLFVNSVLRGESKEYSYRLANIEAILKRFKTENYEHKSILNIALVNYIFKQKMYALQDIVIKTARNNPEFVITYWRDGEFGDEFIEKLFSGWQGAVTQLMAIENQFVQADMFSYYWMVAPHDVWINDYERSVLESVYSYYGMPSLEPLEKMLERYNLKFANLSVPTKGDNKAFDYITKNGYFAISLENLRVIYGKTADDAVFTRIYEGDKETRRYLEENINDVFKIIPDTSVQESEETLVSLLNNPDVDESKLYAYVGKQQERIDTDKLLIESRVKDLLTRTNIIRPTWQNVEKCFGILADTQPLEHYVQENIDELVKEKCESKKAESIEDWLLVKSKLITDEEYEKLAPCFTKPLSFEKIKELPEKRLRILNANHLLAYEDDVTEHLDTISQSLLVQYMQEHFDAFIQQEVPIEITNAIGIEVLNSTMTLEQKKQYMEKYPFEVGGEKSEEYAKLYCFYYEKIGDFAKADMDALIDAMNIYQEDGSWYVKISIVNQINRTLPYDRDIETKLLNTFGEPYNQLSHYGHHAPKFENNPENTELLWYLKDNHPFVSDVKQAMWNHWKVTFRHKSDE